MLSHDLDVLVVEHLADLDDAAKRLQKLEPRLWRGIDELARDAADKNAWIGKFDFCDKEDLWLAPASWKQPKDGKRRGFFSFEFGPGDTGYGTGDEDYFYLTRLCGLGRGQLGFRFKSDVLGTKLRNLARESGTILRNTPFSPDENGWPFMQVQVPHKLLVDAIAADEFETALEPVADRINAMIGSQRAFETFLDKYVSKTSSASRNRS